MFSHPFASVHSTRVARVLYYINSYHTKEEIYGDQGRDLESFDGEQTVLIVKCDLIPVEKSGLPQTTRGKGWRWRSLHFNIAYWIYRQVAGLQNEGGTDALGNTENDRIDFASFFGLLDSVSSAEYPRTLSPSLGRATQAPFGTLASNLETSLTAIIKSVKGSGDVREGV